MSMPENEGEGHQLLASKGDFLVVKGDMVPRQKHEASERTTLNKIGSVGLEKMSGNTTE